MRLFRRSVLAAMLLAACGGDGTTPSAPEPPAAPPAPPTPPTPPTPSAPKATSLSVESGEGQVAAPNEAVPAAPRVLVKDDQGKPMAGVKVIFSIEGGEGQVLGDTALTTANGTASPTRWQLGPLPGPNSLLATVPELTFVRITATARLKITTETVRGQVTLPSGTQLVAGTLRVTSSLTDVAVTSTGKFDAVRDPRGPQLAAVAAPNGNAILLAWIESSQPTFSARTTAQVMAFFDLGGYFGPDSAHRQLVLDWIAHEADLAQLENAITAVLRTNPATMTLLAPSIIAARKAVAQRIAIQAQAFRPASSVFVDPSSVKSGIQVDPVGFNSLTIRNNWRRRVVAFVDRVSYVPKGGGPSVNNPLPGAGIRMTAVTPVLTLMKTAIDVMFGNYAGAPVIAPPQSIPLFPTTALSTKYRVTVVGAGGRQQSVNIPATQRNAQTQAAIETILLDIFLPLLDQALSLESLTRVPGEAEANNIVTKFLDLNPSYVIQAVADGNLSGAVSEVLKVLFDTSAGQNYLEKVIFEQFAGTRGFVDVKALEARYKRQVKALAVIEMFATTIAATSAVIDLGKAFPVEQWDVDVAGANITLTPAVSNISNLELDTFQAKVLDATDGGPAPTFGYIWSTTGKFGKICAAMTNQGTNYCGTSFESSRDIVSYDPDVNNEGTDDITVHVFVNENGIRHIIGDATARITTYKAKVSMLPTNVSIQPTQNVILTATADAPLLNGGVLSYRWSTPGAFGYLGGGGKVIETSSRTMMYTAGDNEGTDVVTVEVFSTKNNVKKSLGSATGSVQVKRERPTTVMGSWYIADAIPVDAGRICIFAYLTFPIVPDAKSYEVHAYGFNDTAFWGRDIRRTFAPPFADWRGCSLTGDPINGKSGGQYQFMLSGGSGPASSLPSSIASLTSRFAGMIVEVTVRY